MRHYYIVSIDTDTGEAVAVEVTAEAFNTPAVGRANVENWGAGEHADAAKDALSAIMPEQDA